MAEGKNIKFTFQLDQQSFQQVRTAVQSLTQELQKMSQVGGPLFGGGNAFGNINIGGTAPSKQQTIAQGQQKQAQAFGGTNTTMGKVILDNANAFKKFAQDGKEASKIMTEALKRDITEQERSLDRLKSKLQGLNEEFAEATKKQKEFVDAGKTAEASTVGKYIQSLEGRLADTAGQTLQAHKNLAGSQQALASAGGGGGGFLQSIGISGSGFGGGAMGAVTGAGKLIGGLATAAVAGIQEYMAGTRMYGQAEATRGAMVSGDVRAFRAGDISYLQSMRMISRDSEKQKDFIAQQGTIAQAEGYATGVANMAGDILNKVTMGLSDRLTGRKSGAIGSSMTTAAQEDRMYRNAREFVENQKNSAEMLNTRLATEYFTGSLGSRIGAARLMGLGIRERPGRGMYDSYGNFDAKLTESGYSPDAYMGTLSGLIGMGGRTFADKLAYEQMAASQVGQGGYASAVLALAMARGGNVNQGRLGVRNAIGTGVGGKRMDVTAGFGLANVLGGYDPRLGSVNTEGLLSGFMTGIGGTGNSVADIMNVQSFGGGMSFGNRFSSGSLDPLQMGKNTVMAANVLGKGYDTYAIDYLANMDIKKLIAGMGGKIDRTATNLGIGQSQFQAYGSEMLGRMFDNFYGGGKIGSAVDAFKKSGLSITEYLRKNPDQYGLLSDAMSLGSASGLELDTSESFLRAIAGIGGKIKGGGVGGGPLDQPTGSALGAQGAFKRQDATELARMETAGELSSDFQRLPQMARTLTNFGQSLGSSAKDFIDAIQAMTNAMNKASGGGGFKIQSK